MNQDFWTFAYLKNFQAQVQAPSPIKTPTPKTKTKSLKGTRGITKDLGLMLSYIPPKTSVYRIYWPHLVLFTLGQISTDAKIDRMASIGPFTSQRRYKLGIAQEVLISLMLDLLC